MTGLRAGGTGESYRDVTCDVTEEAQSQSRHVAAAVYQPWRLNGVQHFALAFKALFLFCFSPWAHRRYALLDPLLNSYPRYFFLPGSPVFIHSSGIHSSSSLGSLLVSLRCHALREFLLTPHLKFTPFSVTICHDHYSLHLPTIQESLFDFPSWVTYENVPNLSRVILYNFLFFSSQHMSLSKDRFIYPFFSCKLSLPIRGLACLCHFYIPLTRRMVLKK